MIRRITSAAVLLGLISLSSPAVAQRGIRPVSSGTLFNVTPYAGYMIFGDFLRGPVGTTLSLGNSAVYGAQVGMQIAPNVSVIGNVAHSSSDLQVGVPFLNELNVGTSGVWLYDGGLQLDISTGGSASPIKPFVQVGAGAVRYDIAAASIVKTTSTNFAFNAGAGLEYEMTPTVGFRLFAKDYIGKFDVREATSVDMDTRVVQNWALTAGLRVGF